MPGTADGDVVSRCLVLGRAGGVHHGGNPVVHHHFVEGLHVARRRDHAWADLSTDLMIEQVLIYAQNENKWRSDQRQRND